MTAEQVVLDSGSFWALVVLVVLASAVALVAAVAAWRSSKASRAALGALEAARREFVATEHEWQERSSVPRRAEDAGRPQGGIPAPAEPPRPGPPAPVAPAAPSAPRSTDALMDPDRPGTVLRADSNPGGSPSPPSAVAIPVPEGMRTEPLSGPRTSAPRVAPADVEVVSSPRPPEAAFSHLPGPVPVPVDPAPIDVPLARIDVPVAPERPAAAERPDPAAARLLRLEDPDPFVRIEAIENLRGHPALVDALLRALHDDFPVVRRQAVRALKQAGGPEATKALLEVANSDTSAEVREEAVVALAAMLRNGGPKSSNSRPSS